MFIIIDKIRCLLKLMSLSQSTGIRRFEAPPSFDASRRLHFQGFELPDNNESENDDARKAALDRPAR